MAISKEMLQNLLEDENDIIRDLARHVAEYRRILHKQDGYRADARRYRWLRDTNEMPFRNWLEDGQCEKGGIDTIFRFDGDQVSTALSPDEMDKAIDEAKRRWPL